MSTPTIRSVHALITNNSSWFRFTEIEACRGIQSKIVTHHLQESMLIIR